MHFLSVEIRLTLIYSYSSLDPAVFIAPIHTEAVNSHQFAREQQAVLCCQGLQVTRAVLNLKVQVVHTPYSYVRRKNSLLC